MARITIQMGHVNGDGGSEIERQFVQALAPCIAARLRSVGHQVQIMDARPPAPPGDVFVALHTDANSGAHIDTDDQERGPEKSICADSHAKPSRLWSKERVLPEERHMWLATRI